MNTAAFIARRLNKVVQDESRISRPIVRIGILAVALGVAVMLISVATGIGLQQKIRDKIAAFNGHIQIAAFDDNQSEVSVAPLTLDKSYYPSMPAVPQVKHVQAVATKAGIIRTEETFEGILYKGVGREYDWNRFGEFLTEGSLPQFADTLSNQVLLSDYIARRLNLKVGDRFTTFFLKEQNQSMPHLRTFTITGLFSTGMQEFDASYVIGDLRHVQRMNRWTPEQVGSLELFIDDFTRINPVGEAVYEAVPYHLNTNTITEKYQFIFEWLKLFDFNIAVIIGIMILVATINMIVTLLVLILERSTMVGILKSLGANNWLVRKIFLHNAFYILLRGLFWGNLIGLGLLFLQWQFGLIRLNPENYYVTVAPVVFNPGHILLINLGTVLVTLLILLIPSLLITRISPIKVLRFD